MWGRALRNSIHKRLIEIVDPPSTAIDALMGLDLASGVDVEIKLMRLDKL